jgi:uncharacterized protein
VAGAARSYIHRVKPGDHPDFYRFAPPPGTSRQSSIRLDASGVFWHDGQRIDTPALAAALHRWIARHPDDGRFILTNGYDWTYFHVEDAPYTVRSIRIETDAVVLLLSDGTEEPLAADRVRIGAGDAVYASVKDGRFEAKFSRHAQTELAPVLAPGPDGAPELLIGGRSYRVARG